MLHFRRTAMEDYELGGKQIKKGDKVVIWHISANRDEAVFDDPVPLRHRALARTTTSRFGGGGPTSASAPTWPAWSCDLIFDEILDRVPDMTSAGETEYLRSNFIGGIKHMPVQFTPSARTH